jgi:HSP20 family molecular chaperone IbpA
MAQSENQRLRRSLGGYRRTDVEVALAELRLTVRHLQDDLAETRERMHEAERELREARIEVDSRRARELEVQQQFEAAGERAKELQIAAEAEARTILAQAEELAAKTRAEGHLRSESISGQVDELLRLRDTLVQTMRGVIRDFDWAVERVEKGESVLPAEQVQAPQTTTATEPVQARSDRPRTPEDEHEFEGHVELDAGPFGDFAALSAFERALARLPRVEDVYVRRFAGERALIEVSLGQPLAFVAAMRDALPFELAIDKIEQNRISVTVAVAAGAF